MFTDRQLERLNKFHKECGSGIRYINVDGPDFSKPFNKEETIKYIQEAIKNYNMGEA